MVKVLPQSLHLYRISPVAVLPYLMILVLLQSLHVLGVNELRRPISLSSLGLVCFLSQLSLVHPSMNFSTGIAFGLSSQGVALRDSHLYLLFMCGSPQTERASRWGTSTSSSTLWLNQFVYSNYTVFYLFYQHGAEYDFLIKMPFAAKILNGDTNNTHKYA